MNEKLEDEGWITDRSPNENGDYQVLLSNGHVTGDCWWNGWVHPEIVVAWRAKEQTPTSSE